MNISIRRSKIEVTLNYAYARLGSREYFFELASFDRGRGDKWFDLCRDATGFDLILWRFRLVAGPA